jgi:hypothetical protein
LAGRFVFAMFCRFKRIRPKKVEAAMILKIAMCFALLAVPSLAFAQTTDTAPQLAPPEVLAVAKASFGPMCEFEGEAGPEERYKAYELTYKDDGDAPDQAARKATLHEVFCLSGAYNLVTVYLITKEDEGTQPVHFAAPAFRAVYEDDDSNKGVLRIDIKGFSTLKMLVNASFDAQSGQMTHFSKWRGVGDASSSGRWNFFDGEFVLTHFEVDASYDGEINPTVIYDAVPETP